MTFSRSMLGGVTAGRRGSRLATTEVGPPRLRGRVLAADLGRVRSRSQLAGNAASSSDGRRGNVLLLDEGVLDGRRRFRGQCIDDDARAWPDAVRLGFIS